jgi:hypothetical protein
MKYIRLHTLSFSFIFFLSLLLAAACKNNTTPTAEKNPTTAFKDCKYGTPTAIFVEPASDITYHTFVLSKDVATENITFKDGTLLDVEQSGCDFIQQQYTFTFKGDFSKLSDAEWKQEAVDWFKKIGSFSQKYAPFSQWGEAMKNMPTENRLGEQYQLEKGADYTAFIKIDKIVSPTEAKLIVTEIIK